MSAYDKKQVNTVKQMCEDIQILESWTKNTKKYFRFRLKPNLRVGTDFGTVNILIGIEHPESEVTFI